MDGVDERRFPHLASYVASLPRGLDAYDTCKVKASVMRKSLDSKPITEALGGIPDVLLALAANPPPVSVWVHEVKAAAITLTIRDLHFTSDDAFLAWVKQMNVQLLHGPLYRLLMLAVTPALLARTLPVRWSQFHQGTTLDGKLDGQSIVGVFGFPPHLIDGLMARAFGKAFEAAIEAAGGKDATSEVTELKPREAHFRCTWR